MNITKFGWKKLNTICVRAGNANSDTEACCVKSQENEVERMLLLINIQGPQHCIEFSLVNNNTTPI